MADSTTVLSPEAQAAAAAKFQKQEMIKKIIWVTVIAFVAWFAYKSFIR